jgi:hypothetical protein
MAIKLEGGGGKDFMAISGGIFFSASLTEMHVCCSKIFLNLKEGIDYLFDNITIF